MNWRTFTLLLASGSLGVAWGAWNLAMTGGARGEDQIRPLVWVVFAGPFALWIGWIIARWGERALASLVCACLYFFTFFIAARIETLFVAANVMRNSNHSIYFNAVLAIHSIATLSIALWRARVAPTATQ